MNYRVLSDDKTRRNRKKIQKKEEHKVKPLKDTDTKIQVIIIKKNVTE